MRGFLAPPPHLLPPLFIPGEHKPVAGGEVTQCFFWLLPGRSGLPRAALKAALSPWPGLEAFGPGRNRRFSSRQSPRPRCFHLLTVSGAAEGPFLLSCLATNHLENGTQSKAGELNGQSPGEEEATPPVAHSPKAGHEASSEISTALLTASVQAGHLSKKSPAELDQGEPPPPTASNLFQAWPASQQAGPRAQGLTAQSPPSRGIQRLTASVNGMEAPFAPPHEQPPFTESQTGNPPKPHSRLCPELYTHTQTHTFSIRLK